MRQFFLVALVTLLLAGEGYCLVTTKSKQDYQQAKATSVELQEKILELSASLRNGEIEKYNQAKSDYEAKLDEFAKYAEGSNVYEQLKSYKDWLDSGETDKLLYFNAKLSEYNRSKPQNIDEQVEQIRQLQSELDFSKTTSDNIAKLVSFLFFGCYLTVTVEHFDICVVGSDLLDAFPIEQICTAVAYLSDQHFVFCGPQNRQRGSHAGE